MLCIIPTLHLGKSVTLMMIVMTRDYFYWFPSIKFNFRVVHAKNNTKVGSYYIKVKKLLLRFEQVKVEMAMEMEKRRRKEGEKGKGSRPPS